MFVWGTNGVGGFFFAILPFLGGCTTFFPLGGRCDKTTKVSYESLEDEIRGGGTSPEENARTNTAKKRKERKKSFFLLNLLYIPRMFATKGDFCVVEFLTFLCFHLSNLFFVPRSLSQISPPTYSRKKYPSLE